MGVAIIAGDWLSYYSNGVVTTVDDCNDAEAGNYVNHAVTVIGYTDDATNPAWIV